MIFFSLCLPFFMFGDITSPSNCLQKPSSQHPHSSQPTFHFSGSNVYECLLISIVHCPLFIPYLLYWNTLIYTEIALVRITNAFHIAKCNCFIFLYLSSLAFEGYLTHLAISSRNILFSWFLLLTLPSVSCWQTLPQADLSIWRSWAPFFALFALYPLYSPQNELINSHSFQFHLYADDSQMYKSLVLTFHWAWASGLYI